VNPRSFLQRKELPALVAAAFAALAMLRVARYAWRMLPRVEGWEADHIARAIAAGHGFSFPGDWRLLWDLSAGDPNEFFPTAWMDPVYTYLLAGKHVLFGEHVYTAAYAVSFVCIAIIFYCVYRLGSRIRGPWSGALAVILLALHGGLFVSFFADINSTGFATCILTTYVLVAVRYFEAPSRLRLVVLGIATGVMVLSWPAAVYFAYALVAAVAFYHRARLRAAAVRAAAVLALAAIVVLPWTVRNYVTFGEYIMVRTGSGQLAYSATVGAASTFMPEVARTTVPAPWTSSGPMDAVRTILTDREKRILIDFFTFDSILQSPPPGYEQMNEAQRDQIYLARAKEFVLAHPWVFLQMAVVKMTFYVMRFGLYGLMLIVLAVLGALLAIRDPRSWPATLLVASHSGLFLLVMPHFSRYRAPVEPVIVLLMTIPLALAAEWLVAAYRRRNPPSDKTAHESRPGLHHGAGL
jgi:4-amino-4-deoxy-L-arabinose transferase-like glycosyltransferase